MELQLSAQGARLFRAARDQIVAHPAQFYMGAWDCGTTCCIGGWLERLGSRETRVSRPLSFNIFLRMLFTVPDQLQDEPLRAGFYFAPGPDMTQLGILDIPESLRDLLWSWPHPTDVLIAAERINRFLWLHGYAPHEVELPVPEETVSV